MEARPWPSAAYMSSNNGDNSSKAASAKRLIVRNGWSAGMSVSGSINANMLACFLARPRTAATSVVGAITVLNQLTLPEDPPPAPSQQSARPSSKRLASNLAKPARLVDFDPLSGENYESWRPERRGTSSTD